MTGDTQAATGVRGERSHAEFLGATWTSFDRYARYGALARAVRASLGAGVHAVLDVGDASGYLRIFDAGLESISVDLTSNGEALPGAVRLVGDGTSLPVRDQAFPAVISSDALEHVPGELRPHFLGELVRASSDLVVVAAPFDTPGVAGVEELVRRYAMLATGQPQEQLDEHSVRVLPSLEDTVATLEGLGLEVEWCGNGNLHDWLLVMLLKFQLDARPALLPLNAGYDLLYNLLLSGRNEVGPYYRHVLVARRPAKGKPAFGDPLPVIEGTPGDLSGLVAALLSANATEATRQDVVPRLDGLEMALASSNARLEARLDAIADQLTTVVHASDDMQSKMNRLLGVVRHPMKAVVRRARHRPPPAE